MMALVLATGLLSFVTSNKQNTKLYGIWVYADRKHDTIEYVKSDTFMTDKPGMEFKAGGTLVQRMIDGWCGTPPIYYKNYPGKWKFTADSELRITYAFWGGKVRDVLQIIELNDHRMKVKIIHHKTRHTHRRREIQ